MPPETPEPVDLLVRRLSELMYQHMTEEAIGAVIVEMEHQSARISDDLMDGIRLGVAFGFTTFFETIDKRAQALDAEKFTHYSMDVVGRKLRS